MLAAHGRLTLREVLQPAIDYAEDGFPVAPGDAESWRQSEALLRQDTEAARTLLVDGRAPRAGDVVVQPELARSLRIVAEGGRDAFYEGEIADRLVAYAREKGGLIDRDDLARYRAEWQEPIDTDYRGYRIVECPPNGQGLAALIALNAVSGVDLAQHARQSPECWHLLIEAMKEGMIETQRHVADPRFANVPVARLLAGAKAPGRWSASAPMARAPARSDTVYLAATDAEGNAVSFINSI